MGNSTCSTNRRCNGGSGGRCSKSITGQARAPEAIPPVQTEVVEDAVVQAAQVVQTVGTVQVEATQAL